MAETRYNYEKEHDLALLDWEIKEAESAGHFNSNYSFTNATGNDIEIVFDGLLDTASQSNLQTLIDNHEPSEEKLEEVLQTSKPDNLKAVENKFMELCYQLSGQMVKLPFTTLADSIDALLLTDPNTAVVLSLRLLAIDAEAKREGGLDWWDTCTYHTDIAGATVKKSKWNPKNWFTKHKSK